MAVPAPYLDVVHELTRLLGETFGDRLTSVAVFGSVARGNPRPESDIDLIVLLRGSTEGAYRAMVPAILALRRTAPYRAMATKGIDPEPFPIVWSIDEVDDHVGMMLEVRDAAAVILDAHGVLAAAFERLDRRQAAGEIRKVGLADGAYFWDLRGMVDHHEGSGG